MLNRMETEMPGTKRSFIQKFLQSAQPLFVAPDGSPPRECERCGLPSFAPVCSFCKLVGEVERKAAQARPDPPHPASAAPTVSEPAG